MRYFKVWNKNGDCSFASGNAWIEKCSWSLYWLWGHAHPVEASQLVPSSQLVQEL